MKTLTPFTLFLMVTSIVILCGCDIASQGPIVLEESSSGRLIQLHLKDKLVVVLDSNPTTGYDWELVSRDKKTLKVALKPRYKSQSNLMGAGGKKIFTFKVIGKGKGDLVLKYKRPWETNKAAVKTFRVTLEAK